MNPLLADRILMDLVFRWNQKQAVNANLSFDFGMYDVTLMEKVMKIRNTYPRAF